MRESSYLLKPKVGAAEPEVTRLKTGGLSVKISRPDFESYRLASGANLGRILQRLESSVDFIIVTSFRAFDVVDGALVPRSKSKNEKLFSGVPAEVRSELGTTRIGAYWLVGHWTESTPQGVVDSVEYSWLLAKDDPQVSEKAWLDIGTHLARKYDQDAFIIRQGGTMTLRSKDGSVLQTLSTVGAVEDAWANLAKLRESGQPYGYSEVGKLHGRGRHIPLVFPETKAASGAYRVTGSGAAYKPEFFVAEPHNNSSKQYFKALGVQYRLP